MPDLVHADQFTTRLLASNLVLLVAKPFVAVRFGNSAPVGWDGFVFDDLTVGAVAQVVPEPGTWALLGAGRAGVVAFARRASVRCA